MCVYVCGHVQGHVYTYITGVQYPHANNVYRGKHVLVPTCLHYQCQ